MAQWRTLLGLAVSLAVLLGPLAHAHNGRLAMGPLVEGIVVDADLRDWPDYLPRYPITNAEEGSLPNSAADLSASFRVAYSETHNRVFVAVEVVDESVVVPPVSQTDWSSADGCELYVDPSHGRVAACQLSQWGDASSVLGGQVQGADLYRVAVDRRPGHQVYEWWVDVGRLAPKDAHLEPGVDLAFDVVVADRDEDGSFTWLSWGPHTRKLEARGRLGDLLVLGGGQSLGEAISSSGQLLGRTVRRAQDEARRESAYLLFLAGALLAVTVLHLLLFGFQRETRLNLYYGLYTGAAGAAIFGAYLAPALQADAAMAGAVVRASTIVIYGASLLLLYTVFVGSVPRHGRRLLTALAGACAVTLVVPETGDWSSPLQVLSVLSSVAVFAAFVEIGRLVLRAVYRRQDGAWSVGVGFLVFALCLGYVVYRLLGSEPLSPVYLAGIVVPMASMSYRLARSVAGAHRDLGRRYEEVAALSRQTQEQLTRLEEAHRELELANQKIREQNRQVEEANRLKSDFLARMSHDLRTPLNAIIGYTRILLRRTQGAIDERQYRNLENVRISADNLLALINDILDLSRIESGRTELHLEDVDVRALAGECAAAVESLVPHGVELVRELDGGQGMGSGILRTDADRLRRVLMNLLGNAVKYTEAGRITLRLVPLEDGVELSVADTGVGIPADDLPYIFDEFRQVERKDKKREGSGLGLAIARRSVAMLGGTLAVDSTVGQGSTFAIRLPHAPSAPSASS